MATISALHFYQFFLLLTLPLFQQKAFGQDLTSYHHDIKVQSLVEEEACTPSKGSDSSKLQLVQRQGPCSPFKNSNSNSNQIFDQDKLRVHFLHTKAQKNPSRNINTQAFTTIPTKQGLSLDTANYVIALKFGTPKVTQSLVFDTGSDLTWIQCRPCTSSCYKQKDKLFNPRKSSTYSNISCSSSYCKALDSPSCSRSNCKYSIRYGDDSETEGLYAKDTVTVNSNEVIENFRFGCGQRNTGMFGRVAGLLGLGREPDSFVQQSYGKYGGVFEYCLPAKSSMYGYLSFGRKSNNSNVKYTPLLTYSTMPSFYFVELMSISVGGKKLEVAPTVFSNAGSLLDSGTVITRLPPTAYIALRTAFRKGMGKYPKAEGMSILDTCYDLSKYGRVEIPKVTLNFRGVRVKLHALGTVYVISKKQVCLAFAPNGDDSDMVIIGNSQQKTFKIVHDLSSKLIGFGTRGC